MDNVHHNIHNKRTLMPKPWKNNQKYSIPIHVKVINFSEIWRRISSINNWINKQPDICRHAMTAVDRSSIYRCDCTHFGWTIARAARYHAKYMERKPPAETCLIKAGPDQPQTDTPNCVHLTGHASRHSTRLHKFVLFSQLLSLIYVPK
jgi:hypothetical protein